MSGKFDDGAAWSKLLSVHAVMMHRLEEMLQSKYRISHGEFEVLLRLSWSTDQRMRIRELADASVITRSGMSRLVDRLENAGLVQRETAIEDARGAYAILTSAGRERLDAAEASNIALVRESFLSLYKEDELGQMVEFWTRFFNHPSPEPDS
ncbi:MAG: MarR family transcriptional regulator [Chloroflexota bacterium]